MCFHPHEVWLRKGDIREDGAGNVEEWYKEPPIKVCMARNMKGDGTPRAHGQQIVAYMAAKETRHFKPIDHPDFESYDGPIPLDPLKARDLYKLGKYITSISAAAVALLYPKPANFEELEAQDDEDDEEDGEEEDE